MEDTQSLRYSAEHVRTAIWDSMLDAQLSGCYWGAMSRRYYKRHRSVEIFLAITASSVVGGWIASWAASSHPLGSVMGVLWKILSGISALTAIILPKLNWQEKMKEMSTLIGEWVQIQSKYEILWFDYESGRDLDGIVETYKHIKKEEPLKAEMSPGLPNDDQELWEYCQCEIEESRGLTQKRHQKEENSVRR